MLRGQPVVSNVLFNNHWELSLGEVKRTNLSSEITILITLKVVRFHGFFTLEMLSIEKIKKKRRKEKEIAFDENVFTLPINGKVFEGGTVIGFRGILQDFQKYEETLRCAT